jgi:sec-independent protein translocase protein TatC
MFYIREMLFRSKYTIFTVFSVFFICFIYKNVLVFLLTESVLSCLTTAPFYKVDHFIYTHPTELFTVQVLLVVYFCLFFTFSYFIWQIFDFLKSSISKSEYFRFQNILCFAIFFIIVSNVLGLYYIFPNIWFFLESFNCSLTLHQSSTFFLELRIYEYFLFTTNFIRVINLSMLFMLSLLIVFLFYGLKNLIYWKKLFIFFNMVFATLLSPPDIYSQLIIFLILTLLLECLICILVVTNKTRKFIFFNTVTY